MDYGVITPCMGLITPYMGLMNAFLKLITACLGLITAFLGLINPFMGLINPLMGFTNPFMGLRSGSGHSSGCIWGPFPKQFFLCHVFFACFGPLVAGIGLSSKSHAECSHRGLNFPYHSVTENNPGKK